MRGMKAAVLYELGAPLVIEEVRAPDPGQGQVLVKMAASGVCHTQLLEIRGKRGKDLYLPHMLGHEGAGVVEAVGPGVSRVRAGDHVILSWIVGPGASAAPPTYWKGSQPINAGALTTFQEYTLASENRVTPIRGDMPLDKAALLGCAVATGAGAVLNTAQVKPGTTVAVFGVGGIGLFAVQAAVWRNAARVIAVDVREEKLERARKAGATDAVHAGREDPVRAILDRTEGKGADYAVEAAGLPETMEQAFLSVRTGGGVAALVGNLPRGMKIQIDPFALICGKRLVGSWGGDTDPERDFPGYVDLYFAGKLKLDEMITHRFRLEEINEAFEALEKGEVGRAIVEFCGEEARRA